MPYPGNNSNRLCFSPSALLLGTALVAGCSGTARVSFDGAAPGPDAGLVDAAPVDAARPDANVPDTGPGADAVPSDAAPADAAPADATTGCPALSAEHVEQWWVTPWVAPSSGDAEQVIRLSTQHQLHFARAVISFEMETTDVQGDWTHLGVVRNRAIPGSWTYLAYYGWLLSRNIPTRQIQVALNGCQNGVPYALQPNTTYTVTYDYDAVAGTATLTLEEQGGGTVSTTCPATSSLVPIGQGLHVYIGMQTSHPDYPTVLPPWGWTFRNFVADLTPGGPYGPDAPPCP